MPTNQLTCRLNRRILRKNGGIDLKSIEERETEFANMLLPYENQWIAYVERRGRRIIVSAGMDGMDVIKAAEEKGYTNPVLMKVPSFRAGFLRF